MPGHTSACVFVIPISTPAVFAAEFAPNTFVSGVTPAKTATALFRSSGSKRTTACTEKSGTKRHDGTPQRRNRKLAMKRWLLRTTGPQTVRIPAGGTGRLQRSGTHEFPLDFETLESRNIRDLGRGSKAPLFPLPAASQGQ